MKHPKKFAAKCVTPFLWFDGRVEEAVTFYTSIFENSKVLSVSPMSATFELAGQRFMALNGGPQFHFNEAVSFFVSCETQDEIDYFWDKLSEGGKESRCGWLKDKFGMSWQVVPEILGELLGDEDDGRSQRALQAMLKMNKLDIARLKAAADNDQAH
ncbi:MAG: VOC family protein [Luteolibacter sp.]|uniref:VOC family protein n=1 Tax=Luteolibacter sp. TaxID=1962973 RepID=UPI0032675D39